MLHLTTNGTLRYLCIALSAIILGGSSSFAFAAALQDDHVDDADLNTSSFDNYSTRLIGTWDRSGFLWSTWFTFVQDGTVVITSNMDDTHRGTWRVEDDRLTLNFRGQRRSLGEYSYRMRFDEQTNLRLERENTKGGRQKVYSYERVTGPEDSSPALVSTDSPTLKRLIFEPWSQGNSRSSSSTALTALASLPKDKKMAFINARLGDRIPIREI